MQDNRISIVMPTFNEQVNLRPLHARLAAAADALPEYRFDFVFADDGSTDGSPEVIEALRRDDARVHHVRLSRNCGSHAAAHAGLSLCRGAAAVVMAADLQDPPELIARLLEQWRQGWRVVWGVRCKGPIEGTGSRILASLFYRLMNRLSDVQQPPTGADAFLIDRKVIEAFKSTAEKNTSTSMLIAWLGFPQTRIEYTKAARHAGTSKWSLGKRMKIFFDSLISFSYVPLRVMSFTGLLCALAGLCYSLVIFLSALKGRPVEGWASLMIVVLLMGGVQMMMMGMLGEYLWRTYDETRGRPRYVIEKNTLVE
jgi:glycosyltransferase involved in cell wall biosynthesis